MSYFLEEELSAQGVATKTTLKIRFNQKIYLRIKTLPRQFYEQGLKLQKEYTAQNRDSLLIQHKTCISIWLEALNQLEEMENNDCELRSEVFSPSEEHDFSLTNLPPIATLDDEDPLITPELETSTSSKKYRGVPDQQIISDHNSFLVTPSKPMPKKYRGRSS